MKILLSTIIMLTMLTHTGSPSSIRMLTPPEYTGTDSDHLFVVGRTDASRVEIVVNNRKLYEAAVVDTIFHILITFGYGLNEVLVRPVEDDSVGPEHTARFEILASPYSTGRLRKLYPDYQFHDSDRERACVGCHPEQLDPGMSSSGGVACIGCHRDFEGRTLLHADLDRDDCATCHNLQTHQVEPSGGGISRNPCYRCHPDKIDKFDRQYIHGPVAGGSCAVCHDPHGSPFEHSLINAEEVLCFSCHEFGQESREMPVQHQPFRDGRCEVCHDPHATSYRWVLAKSSEKLCFECHTPLEGLFKDHTHPYNVKPKRRSPPSVQLSGSGKLECISCHNPHASRSEHLLRCDQENTCLGCHEEKL